MHKRKSSLDNRTVKKREKNKNPGSLKNARMRSETRKRISIELKTKEVDKDTRQNRLKKMRTANGCHQKTIKKDLKVKIAVVDLADNHFCDLGVSGHPDRNVQFLSLSVKRTLHATMSSHATVNQSTCVKNDDSLTAWSDDDEIDIDGQLEEEDINEEGDHNQLVLSHALGTPSPIIDSKDVGQLGFTVAQFCEIKLLKLLNDEQVPQSLHKDVLEWSRNAKRLKCSFEPTCTKHSTMITHLTEWQVKQN